MRSGIREALECTIRTSHPLISTFPPIGSVTRPLSAYRQADPQFFAGLGDRHVKILGQLLLAELPQPLGLVEHRVVHRAFRQRPRSGGPLLIGRGKRDHRAHHRARDPRKAGEGARR